MRCRVPRPGSTFRAELDAFVSSPAAGRAFGNVSRRDQDLAGGADRWRQCQLLDGRACPRTTATLRRIPEVADCADRGVGQMIFSCLAPGAKLRPHCGPTNARLTVHMGLIVPPGGSRITVGGEESPLRVLSLWSNDISDAGAIKLADALAVNTSLTTLDLAGNSIGEAGADRLTAAVARNRRLASLDLRNNDVDARDPKAAQERRRRARKARRESMEHAAALAAEDPGGA